MTINARAEEDVEPESIMQKVAKASGANYSFHKETNRFRDTGPQGPVVSLSFVLSLCLPILLSGSLSLSANPFAAITANKRSLYFTLRCLLLPTGRLAYSS